MGVKRFLKLGKFSNVLFANVVQYCREGKGREGNEKKRICGYDLILTMGRLDNP